MNEQYILILAKRPFLDLIDQGVHSLSGIDRVQDKTLQAGKVFDEFQLLRSA